MPGPMRGSWLAVAILLGASLLAGAAQAAPADKHITLEADNGESCLSDQKVDCFRVTNGSLDGFQQGMRVHLLLENVGSAPHNAFVTEGSNADENNVDTPADAAINSTETIEEGGNTSMVFEVPSDAEGLYFWCDVDGHEAGGMWLEASVEAAPNETGPGDSDSPDGNDSTDPGTNGSDDGGDDADESSVPSPGALAVTGAAVAAALIAGRRRSTA